MLEMFSIAAIWLALAVLSTVLANRLKISMALMEICVGAAAGYRWLTKNCPNLILLMKIPLMYKV